MHEADMSSASQLRRGLSQRQLNMIALGGVIGAGEARSSWLRLGLVDKARAAYPIPVTHVVSRQVAVDLAR
jgi:hypothetical protein